MRKLYSKQVITIALLLIALPVVVYFAQKPQDIRDRAAENSQPDEQLNTMWNASDMPEFVEGEVIVKFKRQLRVPQVNEPLKISEIDTNDPSILQKFKTELNSTSLQNVFQFSS